MKTCTDCQHLAKGTVDAPCRECIEKAGATGVPFSLWEKRHEEQKSNVNHPTHYNQGKYECIDVMVETFGKEAAKNFCLLNAFKYVWRTGEKNGMEDIKKAKWYLEKYIELEGEDE